MNDYDDFHDGLVEVEEIDEEEECNWCESADEDFQL